MNFAYYTAGVFLDIGPEATVDQLQTLIDFLVAVKAEMQQPAAVLKKEETDNETDD